MLVGAVAYSVDVSEFPDTKYNLAVSVANPGFVVQYAKFVVPSLLSPVPKEVADYLNRFSNVLEQWAHEIPSEVMMLIGSTNNDNNPSS